MSAVYYVFRIYEMLLSHTNCSSETESVRLFKWADAPICGTEEIKTCLYVEWVNEVHLDDTRQV